MNKINESRNNDESKSYLLIFSEESKETGGPMESCWICGRKGGDQFSGLITKDQRRENKIEKSAQEDKKRFYTQMSHWSIESEIYNQIRIPVCKLCKSLIPISPYVADDKKDISEVFREKDSPTKIKRTKKIIFMSLACVGQATICKRIMNPEWIPSKDDQYCATIDYERYKKEILGTEFTLFNLGGQTSFLDRFTGELAEFIFGGVCAYIFTVDSIDIKEIQRAKYYFDLSLKKIDKYSPQSSVFLFIHKQDLLPKSMKDEVNQTIEDHMLEGVNKKVRTFHTTIYNNTILQAMDAVFREHIQIYEEDLLVDDTSKEDNDKDDEMLVTHLREALKILRDEDEE